MTGDRDGPADPPPARPDASPRVGVLIAEGTEEIEAITPADVLVRAGARVTVLGVGTDAPTGSRGIPLRAHCEVDDMLGEWFEVLVVPGGGAGAEAIAASEPAQRVILDHAARLDRGDAPRVLAAICAAPAVVLGPLGLLAGRRATGYPSTRSTIDDAGTYVDEPVVVDGPLITSQGPATAMAFSLEIVRVACGDAAAERVARELLVSR